MTDQSISQLCDQVRELLPGAPTTDHTTDPMEIAKSVDWFADQHEAQYGPNTVIVGWMRAAAKVLRLTPTMVAALLKLREEVADLRDDYLRRHKDACDRAEKLREIAEIAGDTNKRGWSDFDRIAAIATRKAKP